MRHAGGLRIDHVMGLLRLFWIPEGVAPAEGTYVRYPIDESCWRSSPLESVRNACIVVGEDLGTVPDAVRGTLQRRGRAVVSRAVFRARARRRIPAAGRISAARRSSPSAPTTCRQCTDFGAGTDLAARDALGLFPSAELRDRQYADRATDGSLRALRAKRWLTPALRTLPFDDVIALHRYVARTPCALMTVQLEDVFGETEQANLPATTDDQHPNWRRKVRVDLEDWERDGRFAQHVCQAAIRAERTRRRSRDGADATS